MEQAQSLKLNVTNIHKFLVGSNKQLAKLKKDKQNLLFKYEKQAQRRKKESKIEAKDFGIGGGLKRVASAVSRPAMSFFDRIKEFFGVILLGLLINNLPKILAELKKFFNSGFIKGLRSFLSIIGKGFMAFVDITLSLPQSVRNAFDKTKNDIENQLNAVGGTLDSLVRFFTGGSDNNDTGTEVWRSSTGAAGSWSQVNVDGFGDQYNWSVTLEPFDGYLYAATYNYVDSDNPGFELWRCQTCNGTDWIQVPIAKGLGDTENRAIRSLIDHDGNLYGFTFNRTTGMEVWRTSDGMNWNQIGIDGLGDSNNREPYWDNSVVTHDNLLYVGTTNTANGGEIWQMFAKIYLPLVVR